MGKITYEENINDLEDLDDDEFSEHDDGHDEIAGYYCLECGNVQEASDMCNICMGSALDPIYF